jgi:TetR/AcrR family transcriptional regulator
VPRSSPTTSAAPARPKRRKPGAPARRRDGRSTADRILDAAELRFARTGYEGTSLGDIAAAVKIRVPSLYKHFAGKRQLFLAVLRRLLDPYFELLQQVLTIPEDPDDAERNLLAVVSHYLATPNLARLVQHAALAGGEPLKLIVASWYRPLFERAAELSGGVPALRPDNQAVQMVIAFHSMMSGYVTMAELHGRLTGADPLGAPAVAVQLELMRNLARLLFAAATTSP